MAHYLDVIMFYAVGIFAGAIGGRIAKKWYLSRKQPSLPFKSHSTV